MVSGMNLLWIVNCIRSFLLVSVIELLAARLTSRRCLSCPFGWDIQRERAHQMKTIWTIGDGNIKEKLFGLFGPL
ncbi:hypothetical protein AAC387_Pa08g2385 [Persea americana]